MKVFKIFVLYTLLYIFFIFVYNRFIADLFSYQGYFWNLNIIKIFTGILIILILSILLPKEFSKPSDLLIHIHFIFPFFFMLVLYAVENQATIYILECFFAFSIILLITKIRLTFPILHILEVNLQTIYKTLFIFFILYIIVLSYKYKNYFNLNLSDVYYYRFEIEEISSGLWGYITHSLSIIFASFLGTITLLKKRYGAFLLLILFYIIIFALTSHKQYLFLLFMVMGLHFIIKILKNPIPFVPVILILISILAIILDYLWFEPWIKALFIDRVFFVPVQLNFVYYEFFSSNPKVFWTDSKWLLLDKIIGYPYDLPVPNVIGEFFFNNALTSANTGWLGSGYAHAGFLGLIVYAIFIGLILKFLDQKAKKLGKEFVFISFSPFIISLMLSSDLKTVLLSHGLALYLFILSTFNFRIDKSKSNFGGELYDK
ncbi:hypothetical protein [Sulfurihydrogenibium sp.]|uniref:hypothetical protein n=1 Tax=Sulfurihydrogenibium sp. TaxID=2053621 RepID=UPI00260C17E6|nr:hypothetical protein [Sulfurihydrogenibium sp.]